MPDADPRPPGARAPWASALARWWPGLAALALGILTWPVAGISPRTGLDPSWQVALAVAARDRMSWGDDLVFTFGPLGFLDTPLVVSGGGLALALAWTFALQVGLALSIILAARRSFPWPVGVAVAFLVGILAFEQRETLALIVFLWCAMAIRGDVGDRLGRVLVPIAGLVSAVAVLTKVNVGILCVLMTAVAVWWLPPRRWRALGVHAGSGVVSFVVLWLLAGGSPAQIAPWISRAGQTASGFTAALPAEDASRGWEYPAFILLVAGTAFLAWQHGERPGRWRARCLVVISAVMAFGYFKHGFVRHDFEHSLYTFIVLMAAPFAVVWRGMAGRIAGASMLAAAAVVALGVVARAEQPDVTALFDPHERAGRLAGQVADAVRPSRREELRAEARAQMRRSLRVPPAMIAAIGDDTVHIDPYETSAAWAYDLRWRPVPVFQLYAAYTHDLDRLDADALRDRDAPRWILREAVARIGDRGRENEAPSYTIAMFCNYAETMHSQRWQLLRRTPGRCGPARELGSARAEPNELVPVPPGRPDDLVYASFALDLPLRTRLRSLLYKPRELPLLVLNDNYGTRFAAALAPGEFLMWAPPTLGYTDYASGFGAGTMRLASVPAGFRVTFRAVSMAPPPTGSADVGR